jgi:hypothetical protein
MRNKIEKSWLISELYINIILNCEIIKLMISLK